MIQIREAWIEDADGIIAVLNPIIAARCYTAYVRADNEAGLKAHLGQGFRVVGTARSHAKIDGQYVDDVMIERHL